MPQINSTSQPFDDEAADAPVAPSAAASTSAVDALLDQIDGTLEANAEQFVRSFVQKGGE